METKTTKWSQSISPNYDAPQDSDNDFLCAVQLQRIANSLEEVLRLVKLDQAESKKRWEKESE